MPCPECETNRQYAACFERVLQSLERRYERLERKWQGNPSAENAAAVNAVRLAINQANVEYEKTRNGLIAARIKRSAEIARSRVDNPRHPTEERG